MRPSIRIVTLVLVVWTLGFVGFAVLSSAQAQEPGPTVLDGVYSEAQATRGKAAYLENCSSCHGEDLKGTTGPSLAGADFLKEWNQQSVNALLDEVRTTMPEDAPGRLQRTTYLDIITFILQSNGFPAGKDELANDPEVLKTIKIAKK